MGEAKRRQNALMWREIDGLRQQTIGKLKVKYLEVFGEESRSNHEQFLIRLAWRLQANAEGDLSERPYPSGRNECRGSRACWPWR